MQTRSCHKKLAGSFGLCITRASRLRLISFFIPDPSVFKSRSENFGVQVADMKIVVKLFVFYSVLLQTSAHGPRPSFHLSQAFRDSLGLDSLDAAPKIKQTRRYEEENAQAPSDAERFSREEIRPTRVTSI